MAHPGCDLRVDAEVADAVVTSALFDSAGGDIVRITADGGYDRLKVYEAAARLGADEETGHHQQARAKNTFHRYKRTIGRGLRARGERGQRVELMVGCLILNRMPELGMSESTAIRA